MLDYAHDDLVALIDIPKVLPPRNGKRVHKSTVFRWASRGVRGHTLETVAIGGRTFTSREALDRFLKALNAGSRGEVPTNRSRRAAQDRLRQAEADEAAALGI